MRDSDSEMLTIRKNSSINGNGLLNDNRTKFEILQWKMFVLLSNLHCLNQLFILPIYCFFSNHWSLCYVRHIIRYIILLLNQINIGPNCMSTRTLSWSGVDLRLSLGNLFESPCGIRAERQRKGERKGGKDDREFKAQHTCIVM